MPAARVPGTRHSNDLRRAFTLVELLMVLAILAVCLGLVAPSIGDWSRRDAEQSSVAALRQSLLLARQEAIHCGNELLWQSQEWSERNPGFRILATPDQSIHFHPDGTASTDTRLELYNSLDQLIETLIIQGATGSITVRRSYAQHSKWGR